MGDFFAIQILDRRKSIIKRGWDKSPSLPIVFELSSKTQWLSELYYADFISFYSPTQLCGGGTMKSNSNELPISVPLSLIYQKKGKKLQRMAKITAGNILATLNIFPQIRFVPTQKMRTEPTIERLANASIVIIGEMNCANKVIPS